MKVISFLKDMSEEYCRHFSSWQGRDGCERGHMITDLGVSIEYVHVLGSDSRTRVLAVGPSYDGQVLDYHVALTYSSP